MNKPVEFFFDFISPFGWFAAERIGGIARAHGRNVAWIPLLFGVTVKQTMGLPAVLQTPLKGPYLLHDAERCARLYQFVQRICLSCSGSFFYDQTAPAAATQPRHRDDFVRELVAIIRSESEIIVPYQIAT
jgi:hypothetical protein